MAKKNSDVIMGGFDCPCLNWLNTCLDDAQEVCRATTEPTSGAGTLDLIIPSHRDLVHVSVSVGNRDHK